MEIIIIGTDPPCPRCQETYERVKRMIKNISPEPFLRKVVSSSEEARLFNKIGTAHDIAQWSGIQIDWAMVRELASGEWTPELDQLLMPLTQKAKGEDWIMTPVVVIDGEVAYSGRVPEIDELLMILNKYR
jgi:hypothetical protein